jgi:hypothetical protein
VKSEQHWHGLSSDCCGSAAYRVQLDHYGPVLSSPPWDQSLTAMPEANGFKDPTSGMGPKTEKLKASKCFPLCSQHQTLLAAQFTGGSDTARAALVAIQESERRWKPGEVAPEKRP